MTIAALITEGIGPGGSIKYVMTGGLDISSTIPSIWTPTTPAVTAWSAAAAASGVWTPATPATTPWTPQ